MRTWIAISSLLLGLIMACGVTQAGPLYQISFSGTLRSGTLTDELNDGSQHLYSADITGARISGTMTFDFGAAAAPIISTGQFDSTRIDSNFGPTFITESVSLTGVTLPGNVIPIPATFALQRAAPPAGAEIFNTPMDLQSFAFTSNPDSTGQALLPSIIISDSWDTVDVGETRAIQLGLGISNQTTQLSTSPTGIPSAFMLSGSTLGSSFRFNDFAINRLSTDPILHGVSANYGVGGSFLIDSASGGYLTPEPASTWLVAVSLAGMGVLLIKRTRRATLAVSSRIR